MVDRPARRGTGSLVVTIEGYDMPGRSCAPAGAGGRYENVHVGVQRRGEVVDLVPGDADEPTWSFDVTTRMADDGTPDFGGPFVHGRRGDRFFYLSWGTVDGDFLMFRRAKLHFGDCDGDTLAAALRVGGLVCRVRMSDRCGYPRCARVRPPDAEWTS
ncbi:MAG: DUF5990 family protein [Acidimicrobiales bacterium]